MKAPNIQGLNNSIKIDPAASCCESPKYSGAEQQYSLYRAYCSVVKAPNIQGLNNSVYASLEHVQVVKAPNIQGLNNY